jgi:hypothetical protein
MTHLQYGLPGSRSLPRPLIDVDRRTAAQGYSREQVLAGFIVVTVMSLSLFGLVLWHQTHKACWSQPNPDQSCASDHPAVSPATWSPGGIGSAPKSTLLRSL